MTKRQLQKDLRIYPDALTVKEVAEILRVSTKTVYKLIKENEIPAVKVGREQRVAKSLLITFLQKRGGANVYPNEHFYPRNIIWTCDKSYGSVRVANQKGA